LSNRRVVISSSAPLFRFNRDFCQLDEKGRATGYYSWIEIPFRAEVTVSTNSGRDGALNGAASSTGTAKEQQPPANWWPADRQLRNRNGPSQPDSLLPSSAIADIETAAEEGKNAAKTGVSGIKNPSPTGIC
jgi:hypothetical protein